MKIRGRVVLLAVIVLILARFVAGALLPLSADEAYYWLWSRHLDWGYYDHPPLIAFAIRAGTAVFGEIPFGVRLIGLLSSIVASVAVWRAGAILLKNEKAGGYACLFFNLSLMVAIEAMAATPDALALATSALFVLALAKVEDNGKGAWWLVAGAVAGIGLLAKYTTLFLGAGTLAWLLFDARQRRWLATVWPYAGGLLAALIFAPNLRWNETHNWMTFAFQFGRIGDGHFTLRYLGEFLGAQIGLATPFIFLLAVMGIARRGGRSLLPAALIWPSVVYFLIHSLHDRVQGNWPSFLYPALAIAAADAVTRTDWQGFARALCTVSRRWAVPTAAVLLGLLYVQALTGIVPLGRKDPMQRLLAFGLPDMSREIVREVSARRAGAILTTDYAMTAWLRFYLPADLPVIQIDEDWRWQTAPSASPETFRHPLIYIANVRRERTDIVRHEFASVVPCGVFSRARGNALIEDYAAYCVGHPRKTAEGKIP
jgi:4-amino-4-deoxy-L-arabinose transferase-like glycosyltransferase